MTSDEAEDRVAACLMVATTDGNEWSVNDTPDNRHALMMRHDRLDTKLALCNGEEVILTSRLIVGWGRSTTESRANQRMLNAVLDAEDPECR